MVAKKSEEALPDTPEVDMDRIKAMMGPLPNEQGASLSGSKKGAKKARAASQPDETLAAAAEEANATLKAMSSDMGESTIIKVGDAEVIGATLGNDPDDIASDEYLNALENDPFLAPPTELDEKTIASDTPETAAAVDDIVEEECDVVLKAEDEKRAGIAPIKPPATSFKDKLKNLWSKKWFRILLLAILLLSIAATALIPASRYYVLNKVGIRSSMKISVVDASTLQPLKNVEVSAAGVSAQTDSLGNAKLEHVKLGKTDLVIKKRAFATITKKVIVGWGSNPEGQHRLEVAGDQYTFIVTDLLSGKPIEKAEAASGEGNAVSDKDGKLVLTLDTAKLKDTDEISIVVNAGSYRTETVKITANNKETNSLKMVAERKDVFVSKRSGKYDVYTIDVDGKNEKKIIAGTGVERDDMELSTAQNSDTAAYVATRENTRNSDGYLLSTLYIIDTKTGALVKADQSEQIQLIGWSADQRLVYVKIAAGASAANPKRHRLVSLNTKNVSDTKELAGANYFNDVLMAGDTVLYAPSNSLQDTPKPGLYSVNANGTSALTVTDKEIYNIFRTDYETVNVAGKDGSFSYKIGAPASSFVSAPAVTTNRLYIDSGTTGKSIWIDNRDGKSLLLGYDKATKKDVTLVTKAGTKVPMYWLNDTTIVFRVNDGKEIADYAVSINGGDAKKIQDMTDVSGVGRWYYY